MDLLQVLSERNSVRKEENQNGKDKKDGIFLSELRARGGKMAWAVSRMQGMEYICRRKENPGKGQYDQRPGKSRAGFPLTDRNKRGGQNPDRDGRTGPCTWRRDCQRLSCFGGRGSGNRKVHAAFADVPDSGR